MQFALSDVRYRDMARCEKFFEKLVTELEQTPGVESAGTTNHLPLRKDTQRVGIWLDAQPVHSAETKIVLDNRVVSPGYFRAMGVPLLAGRSFEWSDRTDTQKVAIVNDVFVREFFPRGGVLGKRVTLDLGGSTWTGEIVGVVGGFLGKPIWRRSRGANCSRPIRKRRFREIRWWCGRRALRPTCWETVRGAIGAVRTRRSRSITSAR